MWLLHFPNLDSLNIVVVKNAINQLFEVFDFGLFDSFWKFTPYHVSVLIKVIAEIPCECWWSGSEVFFK